MPKPATFRSYPALLAEHCNYGPYRGAVDRWHDGDTVFCYLDLGVDAYVYRALRLRGIDTSETDSSDPAERMRAQKAVKFAREHVPPGSVVRVTTWGRSFERWVADVEFLQDGTLPQNITTLLLQENLGRPVSLEEQLGRS
jgi:endonuclease YncB( thermonuclease family)